MKLLENSQFEALSSMISVETGVSKITSRIESYSCKMAGDCKRLYKQLHDEKLGTSPNDYQMLGPPSGVQQLGVSPTTISTPILQTYMHSKSFNDDNEYSSSFNGGIDIVSRKTLFYLISTLNASFYPDYDFSNTPSSEFSKEPSLDFVIKSVENYLTTVDAYARLKKQLWDAINKEINLAECEFYSYNPDLTSDPFSEDGSIWYFNYFIYNKKMKRIVYLMCRCTSKTVESNYDEDDAESPDEVMLDEPSDLKSSWTYNFASNQNNTSNKPAANNPTPTMFGLMD